METCPLSQSQGQQTETQIKKEFKMLNQFLIKEEEARISALRDEQRRKAVMIMEKIAEVDIQKTVLSQQIQNINDDLNQDESLFLHVRNLSDVFRHAVLIKKGYPIKSVFFSFISRTLEKQRRGKRHDSHTSALAGKRAQSL